MISRSRSRTRRLCIRGTRKEDRMGRPLSQVISALRPRRQRIEKRCQELKQEVEGLRELRRIAGKAQTDIATALRIKQPSVSKIEKQADMYLSTLRGYVEAIGGELELLVRLPSRRPTHVRQLGDAFDTSAKRARRRRGLRAPPAKAARKAAAR